jgi:purine nucleoside phosphorylase|tara:strand:+ start:954 stop:1694 length:741 start_codon:yes stop_codon:yes gene_type:complete
MMRLGVIGGTAMTSLATDEIEVSRSDNVVAQTDYGQVPMLCVKSGSNELFFIERHHGSGTTPPHQINHRANIQALSGAGVDAILAVCSVGAIPVDFPPGSVGYATQYIDFTGVDMSFFKDDVKFTSMTEPFDSEMNEKLHQVLSKIQPGLELGRTYWLAHGPHFETKAEINAIEKLGGEVVGMTMPRECKLAAELKIPYAAILVSSNWAAGREPGDSSKALNHSEVSATAETKLGPVIECIKAFTQ